MPKRKPKSKKIITAKQAYPWQQASLRSNVVRQVANRERTVMMSIAKTSTK